MSRPDGRTSDLIRRFESLALEKGGGGVAARPPPGVRRASVAAPSEAERAPAATLAAAQSALSAAIAHAKPPAPAVPPVVTRPRRPSASEASKAQSQAALGSPRPQAASPVVATHKGDARQGRGKRLLTQLNERAALDPLLQVSNNSWLQFADKCIDEGRLCQQNNDPETAYLRFMTACNIYTKKFGNLRDGNPIARDPAYLRLRTAVATHLVDDLEKLHALLEHRTVDEPEPAAAARQAGSPSLTAEQLDQMESRFSLLYPKNPHDILQPAPRADSAAMTAAAQAQQAGEEQSRFDAIDAQVRSIDAGVQGLRSREGALAGAATVGQSHASNRISSAVSPLPPPQPAATAASSSGSASANGGGSPASGTQTWSVDPSATTCTARELRGLIDRSRTGINERPKILVLDVRAYQDHVWGHIDHRYVVSIDPAGLRAKCTSADIASSLALLPDDQQRWFRKRNEFDIVVYVSQKMRSFSDADSPERPALEHLNSAIYHCEYEKPLRRPPLFLVGGFDAWVQEAGAQRCRWSEASRRPAAPSYPLPLAPAALDRASAVAAAGSAGANGYHQAPREEDRHRPVRTSATHGYGVPTGPPAAAAAPAYTPAQAPAAPPAAGTPTRTMFDNPT
ncbi:ubiquitin-specific protease doa4, partial [Coemansia nantahalensis]